MPRGCKESAWLIRWLSITAFDLPIYKLHYCYLAEPFGNVPCSTRNIDGQGRRREMAVPQKGWVLLPLHVYSDRKMPVTFS